LANQPSKVMGSVEPSYKPGVKWSDLSSSLPTYAIAAIREALPAFDKKIRGFAMPDAVLTAVETRTYSRLISSWRRSWLCRRYFISRSGWY